MSLDLAALRRQAEACGHILLALHPSVVLELLDGCEARDQLSAALGAWSTAFGTTQLSHAITERDDLRAKLDHIKAMVARRPALDDEPTLYEKVSKAIRVAGEADDLRAKLAEIAKETKMPDGRRLSAWFKDVLAERDALAAQVAALHDDLHGWFSGEYSDDPYEAIPEGARRTRELLADTAQAATEYRERIVREERARVEHSLKSALEGESYFEREAQRMRELVAVHHPPEINEGQASCFLCDAATHLAPEKFHGRTQEGKP